MLVRAVPVASAPTLQTVHAHGALCLRICRVESDGRGLRDRVDLRQHSFDVARGLPAAMFFVWLPSCVRWGLGLWRSVLALREGYYRCSRTPVPLECVPSSG